MISLSRYTELFQVPGVRAALVASIIGRLPIGMATIAILLFLQDRSGSFAVAGSAAALYVLGLATVAPFLGRMIDRLGPLRVLSVSAVIYPGMLLALVLLATHTDSRAWIALTALVAGASFPPITICMRALYPRLVHDVGQLQTAYSVDSALIETIFIAGPALVALFVSAGHPYGAVLFAAVCAAAGNVVFLRSAAVRTWAIHARSERRSLLGPLRFTRLRAVFLSTLLYALAFGLYEIAVTAFAAAHGRPAAAGVILALASVGGATGAIIYGSRDWKVPVPRQFLVLIALMTGGLLLLASLSGLAAFALASVLAGAPMAPVIASQTLLVSRLAPREMLAESFTWSATCLLGGISAGIAAGGLLAEIASPATILLTSAACALLSGVVVWAVFKD